MGPCVGVGGSSVKLCEFPHVAATCSLQVILTEPHRMRLGLLGVEVSHFFL